MMNTGANPLDSLALARFIVDTVEDKKGAQITLLDLRPDAIIADFLVIANGNSDRQLGALAEHVRESVIETYRKKPLIDGTPESGWVLMDYGDVIVHLFLEHERRYYDLEGFWNEKSKVMLTIQ